MRYPIGQPPFQWQGEINQESEQWRGLSAWWPISAMKTGNALLDAARRRVEPFPAAAANQPAFVLQPLTERYGRTLYFIASSHTDANRDYVSIEPIALGTEHTFSYWCAYSNYTSQSYGGVVLGYDNNYYFDWISGAIRYAAFGSGNLAYVTSGITKDTIQHLAIVRSGTSVQFYLNGRPDGALQTIGSNNTVTIRLVGAATTTGPNYHGFKGTLGDTRVYNRALAASEIWQLYDPQTRWELYAMPRPQYWFVPTVAPGGIIPRIMHHRKQQAMS